MMLFVPLGTYGIFGVFIVFLIVTLVLMIFIALVLSHYAVLVITIGLLVISPLIIVLGNFKPFGWLYWTWTKGYGECRCEHHESYRQPMYFYGFPLFADHTQFYDRQDHISAIYGSDKEGI